MNALYPHILSSIGKKALMALSGAGLGLFLLVHLLGNATVFLGRDAFLAHAASLRSLGALVPVLESVLLAIFLLHISLGMTLYLDNLKARPTPYLIKKAAGGSTFGSRTMPYTGLIILIFLVVHCVSFRFSGPDLTSADLVRRNFHGPGPALFTIVSLLALILHGSHGFWGLFQSLGINHPRYDPLIRRGAWLVSLAGGVLFMLIPALTFFVHDFLL